MHRRRAGIAGVGFFVGLALLIIGMSINPVLSVLGFVVMLAAAVTAIYSWQHVNDAPSDAGGHERPKSHQPMPGSHGFMDRIEERWRKRRDEGL